MGQLRAKAIYAKIQKLLFHMIPEKWDRIYLYASVNEHLGNFQTGEMFFYYFPKGILKKKPVNNYEIPTKFDLEEESYIKLVNDLYNTIKELKKEFEKCGERPWTHINIKIEKCKFMVEFFYDDLKISPHSNMENHIIWTYQNLKFPIESYTKEERKIIEEYLTEEAYSKIKKKVYIEAIYQKPIKNVIHYDKEVTKFMTTKVLKEKNGL